MRTDVPDNMPTQSWWCYAQYGIQGIFFISFNLVVNIFTQISLFAPWAHPLVVAIPVPILIPVMVILAISTIYSNLFAKVTQLLPTSAEEGVEQFQRLHKAIERFHNGNQQSGDYVYEIDNESLDHKIQKKLQDLYPVSTSNEASVTFKFEWVPAGKEAKLTEKGCSDETGKPRIVYVYEHALWQRAWHLFWASRYRDAAQCALKQCGEWLLWLVARGVPGLVLLLTGMHALGSLEHFANIASITGRHLVLAFNFTVIFFGKVWINNRLKGNDIVDGAHWWLQRLSDYCYGVQQKVQWTCNHWRLWPSLLFCLASSFVYNFATAFFFSSEGCVDMAIEIFGGAGGAWLDVVQPIVVWVGAICSIPLSIVTALVPFYDRINNFFDSKTPPDTDTNSGTEGQSGGSTVNNVTTEGHQSESSIAKDVTTEGHPKLWCGFVVATVFDNLCYGFNAYFNTCSAFLLIGVSAGIMTSAISFFVAALTALSAIFFCYLKAKGTFSKAIKAKQDLFQRLGLSCT